jgi:hypothetical protein
MRSISFGLRFFRHFISLAILVVAALIISGAVALHAHAHAQIIPSASSVISTSKSIAHDVSPPLSSLRPADRDKDKEEDKDDDDDDDDKVPDLALAPQAAGNRGTNVPPDYISPDILAGTAAVEQKTQGSRPGPELLLSFDGVGEGFVGPQGRVGAQGVRLRNPSDNSLAVGPDHVVQIVNTRMAIFTKKGAKFDVTGKVLYGPVGTGNIFKGFGDAETDNGDAVVRYDQLADRWLIVMPIFHRLPNRTNALPPPRNGGPAQHSQPVMEGQPGPAREVDQPKPVAEGERGGRGRGAGGGGGRAAQNTNAPYAMCYAISTSSDPLGSYYRYEFLRPLFPDYPRPAVWPDGYYVPTSSGDTVIQKQAYVVDRAKMLKGEDAMEQGITIDGVNFLNNSDVDGQRTPPSGAPNIMIAAGGRQLTHILESDALYYWKYHVDWNDPEKTHLDGPMKIPVAPYHYLGGGQLSRAVPQPGVTTRLDSQGDKLMQRLVYRRIGGHESILAVHSIQAADGGGGVRWYELRLDSKREPRLYQQGTYAPGGNFRWLPSPAMDNDGNIGIGYSFGGTNDFPGQRFAGRLANDPLGQLTLHETVLAEGQAPQAENRWEDYTQTAMDPSDDHTIWYVGDYYKKGATYYSTRIGAFRLTPSRLNLGKVPDPAPGDTK